MKHYISNIYPYKLYFGFTMNDLNLIIALKKKIEIQSRYKDKIG